MPKAKKALTLVLYLLAIGTSIGLLFFIIAVTWIGFEVKNDCQQAQELYAGDCVEALSAFVLDENQSLRERNSAIWSLGQMGDARALPALNELYTGDIPDREPLDKTISQYELKKAINLANGGMNIAAWMWR